MRLQESEVVQGDTFVHLLTRNRRGKRGKADSNDGGNIGELHGEFCVLEIGEEVG